ncbi:unnamed protein product [Blepharisma stoltei]|uniref:Uncharacterized protein n=1 Tax=Blepharisma stoltei TaxID=1481888 RepID=A0AAU9JS71_9CILI|nr:unnamed protein product [Blepharisma stoltei]
MPALTGLFKGINYNLFLSSNSFSYNNYRIHHMQIFTLEYLIPTSLHYHQVVTMGKLELWNITTGCIFFRQQRELMELCFYCKLCLKTSIKNFLFWIYKFHEDGYSDNGKIRVMKIITGCIFFRQKRDFIELC